MTALTDALRNNRDGTEPGLQVDDGNGTAPPQHARGTSPAAHDACTHRMLELDNEWDLDRRLGVDVSVPGLLGLALGVAVDKRFLVIPAIAAATLFLQGIRVWHPLRGALRQLGARSEDAIDAERYELKVRRGDFAAMPPVQAAATERAHAAWKAVCR